MFGADSSQEEVFEATTKHLVRKHLSFYPFLFIHQHCTSLLNIKYVATTKQHLKYLSNSIAQVFQKVDNVLNGYNATVFAYGATGEDQQQSFPPKNFSQYFPIKFPMFPRNAFSHCFPQCVLLRFFHSRFPMLSTHV